MRTQTKVRKFKNLLICELLTCLACLFALIPLGTPRADQNKTSEPWGKAQVLQSDEFARELSGTKTSRPVIVYVGFRTLFSGGHIPGATFHGTASTEQGLADFKKWVDALPRTSDIVIYCGCCPFDRCPNIRPAFNALRGMGFTRLRVLVLPTNFAIDWVDKGLPIEKGS